MRKKIIIGLSACIIALILGRWAIGLAHVSELVHFSINFPVGTGHETMPRSDLGGPWTMLDDGEWQGYPEGGLIVWGREEKIVVDLGRQSFIKRMVQPNYISVSSHWVRNVGTRPYTVRVESDLCGLDYKYESFESSWNNDTATLDRPIPPGETFNLDWYIRIPEERRSDEIICSGEIRIVNAETDDVLTRLPLSIVNTEAGESN